MILKEISIPDYSWIRRLQRSPDLNVSRFRILRKSFGPNAKENRYIEIKLTYLIKNSYGNFSMAY